MPNSVEDYGDSHKIYSMISCGRKGPGDGKNENFFVQAYAGVVDAARRSSADIKVEWHGPQSRDPAREADAIRECIARKVAGLIVSAVDQYALNPVIHDAIQAGIPVITFDADAPDSARLTFVGTDNYKAGYLAGLTMAEWLGGQGVVAVPTINNAHNLNERVAGFEAALADHAPHLRSYLLPIAQLLTIDEDGQVEQQSSYRNYHSALQAHPEIRGLFATFAGQGAGAASAVRDAHMQAVVRILTFDIDEEITTLMANGDIHATVGQDPYLMGYVAMILAHAARRAPRLPAQHDGTWRITAIREFLTSPSEVSKNTTSKLTRILAQLESHQPTLPPLHIDTGVEILDKDRLLRVLARELGDMRDSIQEKITALRAEIEDHTRTEAQLARESAMLRTIIDTSLDQIYAKDTHSRFLIANREVVRILGAQTSADVINKTDFDFHAPELAGQYYADERALFASKQALVNHIEPIVDRQTGEKRWLSTSKVPFYDTEGNILGFVGLNRDITDLKQAEEEREERNLLLASAYEEIRTLNLRLEAENMRMSAELNVARQLQTMVLPSSEELANIIELDISGFMQPADEVGGDYYDILPVGDMLVIGIGDVTGHGLESGVLMMMTQTAIRTLIEYDDVDPIAILTTLNRLICKNTARMGVSKMLTLTLLTYRQGQVHIVGQHEDVLVVRKRGLVERIDTTDLGFPVGLVDDIGEWVRAISIDLAPGDGIVLYTDGITEAENCAQEQYGSERLCDVIRQQWQHPAQAIRQAVIADVLAYIGQQKVYDDLTLVVLKQRDSLSE